MRIGDGEYIPNRHGDVVDNAYHETEYERGFNEGFRDGVKAERERQKAKEEVERQRKGKDHGAKTA